jgi:hypothetical protein
MNFGAILLSQINRAGIETPHMEHFKHAGVLEEHSDCCITLNWNWEDGVSKYIVNVEKQRHGIVKNNLEIKFLPQYSTFEDIELGR